MSLKVRVSGVALLTLLSCAGKVEGDKSDYRVFVRVDTVRVSTLSKTVPVWCRVREQGGFTVASDVVGVVDRILKREGAYVRRGDTIMYVLRGPAYGRAPILSPTSGRIDLITVSVGDPVAVGTPVAFLSRGDGKVVEMVVPMAYREKVKVGLPVEYEGRRGEITVLSGVPVKELGGYVAKARIRGVQGGSMGICRIVYEERESLKVVPTVSVYGGKVFKVRGSRVHSVPVRVVFEDDRGNAGVEGDIKVGDTIVVLGMESLREGDRVLF